MWISHDPSSSTAQILQPSVRWDRALGLETGRRTDHVTPRTLSPKRCSSPQLLLYYFPLSRLSFPFSFFILAAFAIITERLPLAATCRRPTLPAFLSSCRRRLAHARLCRLSQRARRQHVHCAIAAATPSPCASTPFSLAFVLSLSPRRIVNATNTRLAVAAFFAWTKHL
jgi:hypothetical protein